MLPMQILARLLLVGLGIYGAYDLTQLAKRGKNAKTSRETNSGGGDSDAASQQTIGDNQFDGESVKNVKKSNKSRVPDEYRAGFSKPNDNQSDPIKPVQTDSVKGASDNVH